MNTSADSLWDHRKTLETAFPKWCHALAKALDAAVEPKREDCNHGWQTLVLADGSRVCLHLNTWDEKVSVSGSWPKDHTGAVVTPRDFLRHGEQAINIHVGAGRDPEAAAKDIKRRFIPTFTQQYAGCLARIADRLAYANKTAQNTERLAAAIGAQAEKSRTGEGSIYPHLPGIYRIAVAGDSATFEARSLRIDQAEQVLRLLATFKTEESAVVEGGVQ